MTREGIPLGYEIFAGNRTEMEERHGKADRIWVMDRGMVSEENLAWLRKEQRRYLVGTPKSQLR